MDFSPWFLQVHAQGRNSSEAQHSSPSTIYPGPQREDLPVLGDERRLPYGVAARGAGPAAPASSQPLSGEEEGDHQEAPLLHRWDQECTAALGRTKFKQEVVAPHQWIGDLSSCHCYSQAAVGSRPLLPVFALLRSLKTHNCNSLSSAISSPVSPLRFASTQMFACSPFMHWLLCLNHKYGRGISGPRPAHFLLSGTAYIDFGSPVCGNICCTYTGKAACRVSPALTLRSVQCSTLSTFTATVSQPCSILVEGFNLRV